MSGNPFSISVHAYDHQGATAYNESGQAEAKWLAEIGFRHTAENTRARRPVFLSLKEVREPRR